MYMCWDGDGGGSSEIPFQERMNVDHQEISARAAGDKWMWWSRDLTEEEASRRLRIKVLPSLTTVAA